MTSEDDIRGFIFKRIIYHLQYKNVLGLKIDGEDKLVQTLFVSSQKKVEVANSKDLQIPPMGDI